MTFDHGGGQYTLPVPPLATSLTAPLKRFTPRGWKSLARSRVRERLKQVIVNVSKTLHDVMYLRFHGFKYRVSQVYLTNAMMFVIIIFVVYIIIYYKYIFIIKLILQYCATIIRFKIFYFYNSTFHVLTFIL